MIAPRTLAPAQTLGSERRRGRCRLPRCVIAFGFVMLYPLLWMVASSFKPADEIFTNVTVADPAQFTLDNYVQGWAGFGGIPFITFFRNSLIYSVASARCWWSAPAR